MLSRNTWRLLQQSGRRTSTSTRFKNTSTKQEYQDQDEAIDFRPPWVYVGSRLMTFVMIPGILFYSIFFYDFGDRDHVFQPARRWALKQKATFLTLSPDEEHILNGNKPKPETS